ncbi:hypothetical protein AT575_07555 [Streptococcus penaeicida]|uniref:Lipoprotein n=1 Tax=Streptococcus penaeicida TaxID=1765960 RepID=A0A2N8LB26_9STRE|nr:hypothetical protein [Streptococcus penaeicida]PND47360.1 hypothetical protein AT575_07555 [Streptococcus penaeicida]
MIFSKNSISRFLVLVSVFLLSGCHAYQAKKDYQFAIFDKKDVQTFSVSKGQLQPLEKLRRKNTKFFEKESFKQAGHRYLAKTLEGDGLKVFLESIDQKTLEEKIQPALGNDAYASITDGKYFYATAVFTDRIDFYKYDLNLKKVLKKSIPNDEHINASNQFLLIDDQLYLLVSYVDKASGLPGTCLWLMDKAFNIKERIDLEDTSAYLRMANVGHTLYLPASFRGRDANGEPLSGRQVMVFDLDSRQKYYFPSSAKYPKSIFYHQGSKQLIIENDAFYNKDFSWTLIEISAMKEKMVKIKPQGKRDYLPPFLANDKSRLYFLFSDQLLDYHLNTGKLKRTDLKLFGIKDAHALIIKKKE